MSDFITGLRGDLAEAAERHARRGRVRRTTWWLHPRAWRPEALVLAVAVAASVVAIAVAVRAFTPPQRQAGTLRVVKQMRIGGQPFDAVSVRGSLWIADFGGRIVRADPRSRKITAVTPVDGDPTSVTVADDTVLALAAADSSMPRARLYALDPSHGRISGDRPLSQAFGEVAVADGGLWFIPSAHRPRIERLDLASGRVVARVHFPEQRAGSPGAFGAATLAVGGDLVWALDRNGTVAAIDTATAEIVQRLARVAVPRAVDGAGLNLLAADATGVWVADESGSRLLRIEAGQVIRRIPLGGEPRSLALAGDALWVGHGDPVRRRYRLSRVDPATGKILATVSLGTRDPKALVPDGSNVWVIAGDGTALLVSS